MERNGITSISLNHEMDELDAQGLTYDTARMLPPAHVQQTPWVDILYVPSADRAGVTWGGDAVWFDATSIEDAYAQFFAGEDDVVDTVCLDGALPPPPSAGYFGRLTLEGHVAVLHVEEGAPATRLDVDHLYPVGSKFSSRYEHPMGIVITRAEADRIGLEME